jgi:hypothetical protein
LKKLLDVTEVVCFDWLLDDIVALRATFLLEESLAEDLDAFLGDMVSKERRLQRIHFTKDWEHRQPGTRRLLSLAA